MKFAENQIGFTINIFDDSDNILPIIQVRGEYVTQMHNTVRIVQLEECNALLARYTECIRGHLWHVVESVQNYAPNR